MNYETVLVLDALQSDAVLEAEVNKAAELIKKNAEVTGVNRWGKRRLAYTIRKKTHGDYTVISFNGSGAFIGDMERGFRINENVLRYLTVRI